MPIAEPVIVTVVNTHIATATATVAEVLISNGVTYTIQLTTIETSDSTTSEAVPTTTSSTSTSSSSIEVVAQAAVVTTSSTSSTIPTTSATPTTDCSTSVSVDSNGVAHVVVTLAQTVVVDVGTANVAPVVAFTTVNVNTLSTTESAGLISLVTANGSVLLPTLTEGLSKDKNVANTMANPATVAVTNASITTSSNTRTISSQTTTSSTSSSSSSTADAVIAVTSSTSGNAAIVAVQTSASSSSSSTSTSSSESTSASSSYLTKVPYSIVYSPYENDGTCKDYSSVLSDLTLIHSKGISELRIYGNDCNYMTTVLKVSKDVGLLVNQGFWISSAGVDSIDDAVSDLITYVSSGAGGYGWEVFSYFTIGNEAIISNYCTVDELIAKISSVKALLQAAGYTGKVTTAEPPVSYENNPSLCTDSEIDFVGINPHSYFDTYSYAYEAGTFVAGQIDIVKGVCGDLDIVVTETGYPNEGNVNGNNVPSAENQLLAVQSILDVVGTEVTILTTFENLWKSPGSYNIEQHFGIIQLLK
ncbi:hypothetical protein C6P42_004305 [Pichia californica]|nr:hypothetical protein C6P42_004305 [[Candida] californica]